MSSGSGQPQEQASSLIGVSFEAGRCGAARVGPASAARRARRRCPDMLPHQIGSFSLVAGASERTALRCRRRGARSRGSCRRAAAPCYRRLRWRRVLGRLNHGAAAPPGLAGSARAVDPPDRKSAARAIREYIRTDGADGRRGCLARGLKVPRAWLEGEGATHALLPRPRTGPPWPPPTRRIKTVRPLRPATNSPSGLRRLTF